MSDIFFSNIDEAPLPPAEVRIRELAARPRRDRARIDVQFALTPFQQRPNIEVAVRDNAGRQVSALSIVEAIEPQMEFTMHLRRAPAGGFYTLELLIFYADIETHAPPKGVEPSAGEILAAAKQIVDRRQVEFEVPAPGQN